MARCRSGLIYARHRSKPRSMGQRLRRLATTEPPASGQPGLACAEPESGADDAKMDERYRGKPLVGQPRKNSHSAICHVLIPVTAREQADTNPTPSLTDFAPIHLRTLLSLYSFSRLFLCTMPPPTASQKPGPKANGGTAAGSTAAKAQAATAAPASTPSAGAASGGATGSGGKPDKAAYDAEQDSLNKQIADVKTKLVSLLSGN